ncbi:MAG: hypothetical protein PHZ26_04050, partial [Candidatus Gracilibacteria bacterium]|nr:hypothetical protein [Candidatus Gracilibacteria bacterium]
KDGGLSKEISRSDGGLSNTEVQRVLIPPAPFIQRGSKVASFIKGGVRRTEDCQRKYHEVTEDYQILKFSEF